MARPKANYDNVDVLACEYARTRDINLRKQLLTAVKAFVWREAHRWATNEAPAEDLYGVGILGAAAAADAFDPSMKHCFITFAGAKAIGHIRRYLRDNTWGVHVPGHVKELSSQASRYAIAMNADLAVEADRQRVANEIGVTREKLEDALAARRYAFRVMRLDHVITNEESYGEEPSFYDLVRSIDPGYNRVDLRLAIQSAFRHLRPPVQEVLVLRYYEGLKPFEVATILGRPRMTVSRQEKEGLRRLRGLLGER